MSADKKKWIVRAAIVLGVACAIIMGASFALTPPPPEPATAPAVQG